MKILCNSKWLECRTEQETYHRSLLLNEAKNYNSEWIFYFDCDERFELDVNELKGLPQEVDGVRISLFDGYMTEFDDASYNGGELMNFRKYFGPEMRDILMIFRNRDYIKFVGLDAREPFGCKNTVTLFYCQHYGKCISEEQWESTCAYYATYFPEPYKSKWEGRKGKHIHTLSDFGRELFTWDEVKYNSIKIN